MSTSAAPSEQRPTLSGTGPASPAVHPVDEILPAPRLIALGLQHVLVMYAGAVAVPLIIGAALKLPREQIAFLITCDLFVSGIATLIQSIGIPKFGIRLPVVMGVTFAAVGPMVAMANDPDLGLPGMDGYGIARCLRADRLTEHLHLIALTGYGQPEDERRALQAGFDLHLTKPVALADLQEAMLSAAAQR